MLSVEARGVWYTRGPYHIRKAHDMAKEQICILNMYVCMYVNVMQALNVVIGEINV